MRARSGPEPRDSIRSARRSRVARIAATAAAPQLASGMRLVEIAPDCAGAGRRWIRPCKVWSWSRRRCAPRMLRITPRRLGEHVWPGVACAHCRSTGTCVVEPRDSTTDFRLRVVTPELLRAMPRASTGVSRGGRATATQSSGAGSEVLQLRDYRSGDPQHLDRLESDSAQRPAGQPRFFGGSAPRDRHCDRRGPRECAARR